MTNHLASPLNQPDGLQIAITALGLSAPAAKILEERGLDIELLVNLGWRSSSKSIGGNAIEIPYLRDGKEVNVKTRTLSGEKKFLQESNAVKCFYNESAIDEWKTSNRPLLICEGEIDCATALQCGYLAVSVPDGAPARQVKDASVKYEYLDGFPSTGLVIICADSDAAGANLLHDLGIRLGKHRCKWVKYPQGCKDLNDALKQYGEKGVHKTVENANWLEVDGIYRMGELPPLSKADQRTIKFIPINIRKRDISIWSGIPGHGKTTATNHISVDFALDGWNIGIGSFEQTPQTQHKYSLRTLLLGKPPKQCHAEKVKEADQFIDQRFTFIVPNIDSDEDANLGWLLEKMAAAVVRNGVDMFIIDPWNEIEHTFDRREMTQTEYTGFAIKQLKKFAKKYDVHVAIVAHPAKMQRNKEGVYPMPSLYDIADSAHWANKADLGVIVFRDEQTHMIVQKSKYHKEIGFPDDYIVNYDPESQRFSNGAVYSCA